jgi:hypothetical protein
MSVCIAVILGVVRAFIYTLASATKARWRKIARCADTQLFNFSTHFAGFVLAIVARIVKTRIGDNRWYLSASLAVANEAAFTRTCKAAKRISADAMLRITIVQWFPILLRETFVNFDAT